AGDARVPALDHLALAELELEGLAAVPGRIELLAGAKCDADVVHRYRLAGHSLVARALDDVVDTELERDVAVGLLDLRPLHVRHSTTMEQISEHVWWLPPGPPDRPSLCGVVGERWTLALDGGASRAHTRLFLDGLPSRPSAVVYTHSHWDHVFGGVEIGGLVLAHRLTAANLAVKAATDWNDDANVNDNIRIELPAPRTVEIAQADVVFDEGVDLDLGGGVVVRVRHVGGAHAADSCVAFVEPDGVLFLGDCLYEAGAGGVTAELAPPLHEAILAFGATLYVEGHHDAVTSPAELDTFLAELRGLMTPAPQPPS